MGKTIKAMEQELTVLKFQASELGERLRRLREKIRIAKANDGDIHVTDHAIIRYLERILGIDIDMIRNKLRPPELIEKVKISNKKVIHSINNFNVIVENKQIITVTTKY